MKSLRILVPSLVLAALTATGCFLVSGQFMVTLDMDDVTVTSAAAITGRYLDLNTEEDYEEHKDKIKNLADVALLGQVHNTLPTPLTLELWMTDTNTGSLTLGDIQTQGVRVWGPLTVAGNGTETLSWDRSAELFGVGKAAVLDQIKSDGAFTLYAVGSTSPFQFEFTHGVFVAVISAGQ